MNIVKALLELLGKLFGKKKQPEALTEASQDEIETPKESEAEEAPEPEPESEYSEEREPALKTPEEWGLHEVEVVLKHGDTGLKVTDFQKKLERLGYELTRHGADGTLGDETLQEVCDFQDDQREKGLDLKAEEHSLKIQGVGRKTFDAIEAEFKKLPFLPPLESPPVEPDADPSDDTPPNFFKLCPDNGKGVKAKRKRKKGWESVGGITRHPTACSLGTKPTR
jgi:peptidoglycan hydrolase-like protein with peptidoglycan-binding domain